MNGFAIAIDGPGGVGKSTSARLVARELGMAYIDTGAMYRAVALYQLESGLDMHDEVSLSASLSDIHLEIENEDGTQKILLNGRDVSDAIRTREAGVGASIVASNLCVREKLAAQQKQMAATGRIVMDGRDIGSKVLPWAQVKIYLDAPPEVRASRRIAELEERNQPADFDQILEEIIARDNRDKNRKHSPLIQAPDAIYLDTTRFKTPEETAAAIVEIYKNFEDTSS